MFNFIFRLPMLVVNTYLALLSPRWLFASTYAPSSEGERQHEQQIQNKLRLAAYYAKR
jgi:hypothetical protein